MGVLSGFFKKEGWRYLPGLVFLIANAALDVVPARLLGEAVDLMREPVIDRAAVFRTLCWMVAAAAGIFLTRSIWRSFINGNARRMEMWLRNTLFTHLQTLGPDFFNHQKTGDLMAYAINDVNAIRMTFGPGFALACTSLFTGAFSIFQMGAGVNLRLALACLIPIPFLLVLIFRLGSITRERFRRVQEAFAAVSDRVQENISGIRVIKAYAQETPEVERFESLKPRHARHERLHGQGLLGHEPDGQLHLRHQLHHLPDLRQPPGAHGRHHPGRARGLQRVSDAHHQPRAVRRARDEHPAARPCLA